MKLLPYIHFHYIWHIEIRRGRKESIGRKIHMRFLFVCTVGCTGLIRTFLFSSTDFFVFRCEGSNFIYVDINWKEMIIFFRQNALLQSNIF